MCSKYKIWHEWTAGSDGYEIGRALWSTDIDIDRYEQSLSLKN